MPVSTVWRIALLGFLALALSSLVPGSGISGSTFAIGPAPAAAAGLIAPPSSCPDNRAGGGARNIARARKSMACMVSYARRRKGLAKYSRRSRLDWSATRKSADIVRCRAFSHNACGRSFDHWIRRSGYVRPTRGWTTGENIAWGTGNVGNVRSIFKAWMKSPGHRRAILDRTFRDFGVGVTRGRMRGLAGARVWVLHFGRID